MERGIRFPGPRRSQPLIQADRGIQLSISPAGTWRYLESLTGLWLPHGVAPLRWRADGLCTQYFHAVVSR